MGSQRKKQDEDLMQLTLQLRNKDNDHKYAKFRGDNLIGNQLVPKVGLWDDFITAVQPANWPSLGRAVTGYLSGTGVDSQSLATIAGSLSNYSVKRQELIDGQVKDKYDKMLHPPLTYLGDAFQYRTADGKFNSVLHPHLGQAGAPYAKTVPSKTAPLGALPDPSDLFDKLMAREEGGRPSTSGLSSMLIYHATIIIHDIFRTNESDKNISDSSSYLDLSPLYGYTPEMQRKVRDDKYKLGLLKPDTFAEDRLLRQPPGVCIMLVMYNRYHNYAARQLARINENGRFSVPKMYAKTKLVSLVKNFNTKELKRELDDKSIKLCDEYETLWRNYEAEGPNGASAPAFKSCRDALEALVHHVTPEKREAFETSYDAAWTKLDDDLFNTARLITCGMYIQISVHDYLRALMGFHQFNTNFTLDPRADFDQKKTSRGIGNQVTVEFNLLYRFHCAISLRDEAYTEEYMKKEMKFDNPRNTPLPDFLERMKKLKIEEYQRQMAGEKKKEPWEVTFGIPDKTTAIPNGKSKESKTGFKEFKRNKTTNLFDDQQMLDTLTAAMDDPISNFGPRNTPKCLKAVEIMGILQARKWEVGTLNDFRDFFGMHRHETFESVTKNVEIQNALRDLYEHPDKIELYPGIFCESDEYMGLDPGPKQNSSALWTAIFSDAITLVRSDRFYTVDWNTNSLTSWGMKEVTPDNDICKSSVFHRLIQRAFPGWFPYNTIRFFHPFYTAEQNAIYAKAQGYGPQFKETQVPDFELEVSPPKKPKKPRYLDKLEHISEVLKDESKSFINPALSHRENLPQVMKDILESNDEPEIPPGDLDDYVASIEGGLKKYLEDLMRGIVMRESIAMTNSTFQIDATRDFAIPVVTKYVADFLGFGDKLRSPSSPSNPFTENEIYQHITNCQIFLSYNADETKLLKRRNAFKASMEFLIGLTQRGNIFEAGQWAITHALFGKKKMNDMSKLGVFVAKKVLQHERDQGKAAAILLLICLDFAYNAVVSFTATLDQYMKDLYRAADLPKEAAIAAGPPQWLEVQKLAFGTMPYDDWELEQLIRVTSQKTVRLPIIRKAIQKQTFSFGTIDEGQTVILDLSKAIAEAEKVRNGDEVEFLTSQLSIADKYGAFQPRRFASLALTSMIKFVAQMKDVRRGHDAQGRLKKVRIDQTTEGYSNYMAPMRVRSIRERVKGLQPGHADKDIFTDEVLKPAADTYLTPTWDEMVPFPMTWKIRFDGFGQSNYRVDSHPYGRVHTSVLPDHVPPFYQPQGPSTTGGTFAGPACICAAAKAATDAKAKKRAEENAARVARGEAPLKGELEDAKYCVCFGPQKDKNKEKKEGKEVKPVQLSTGCSLSH
ncbi:putative prostaglandin G/H synthase 2/cyclooxygenase 2, pgh2/cox2 [Stachybotrys elegans]|uniref:Prostaglandin G/H synthase 2/cyclooxygenase 2, pgh2/cox2 n=1 Tax=Stachybotrys elegans TaxID=80388 RepID=A0A8K0WX71_9HYPO|nr:putative prostaglandin G/H synthase 2/cyclooxygenase 2, pgh2/cox2 [Stachybotrys elegans]